MQRKFIPGDQWLYVKIYTGIHISDQILLKAILPLCNKLIKEKIINSWFFIRYDDAGFHIRVRMLLVDTLYAGEVITRIKVALSKYLQAELIWKIQYDTYIRELERYGFQTTHLSEKYFYYNSIDILRILKYNKKVNKEQWYYAFKMVDSILENFNLSIKEKITLLKELDHDFQTEFQIDYPSSHQLGKKYRSIKEHIEEAMSDKAIERIINRNIKQKRQLALQIQMEIFQKEAVYLHDLIKSHIHMCLNRLIQFQQRTHELVIYNSILRYYISKNIQQNNLIK